MSLWYAVVRDGAVLHFGQDRPVAAYNFTQHEGASLFTVQSLCELDSILKGPQVSAQNVSEPATEAACCGGGCQPDDLLEEARQGLADAVQVVKNTTLEGLKRIGVSEDDLKEFAIWSRSGAEEIGNNIKAGGEQAVERTKAIGKVLGGWFQKLGEKLKAEK